MYVDSIYSHYMYVKGRLATINPARTVKAILDASDWPAPPVVTEAFYLLVLADSAAGRQFYSAAIPVKFHHVQWVWINKGTDLAQGQRKANRGDRFFTMMQMRGELTQALYPNFCEKFTWALDGAGNFESTPENPVEYITWTPVEFQKKSAQDSGVSWGSGATKIWDMTDLITS